ncbi:GLIPR1-like protein 1 [Antedon mediterranea]|uniref:GLIPR1-like protein 1 n=1 Tax=Antedon mediterranea TaxID=105859 RepID=UPI003AF86C02
MLYTFVIKIIWFSIIAHVVALEKPRTLKSNAVLEPSIIGKMNHERRRRNTGDYTDFTPEEIEGIVDLHNQYRRNVSPGPASDMQYMEWNNNLADLAQQWADRCVWEHGNVVNDLYPEDALGQNLFVTSESLENNRPTTFGTDAITSWHSEVQDYHYNSNTCTEGETCGHYTQVVWASTYNVGCGIKTCTPVIGVPWSSGTIIVCNYISRGNQVGQWPYQVLGQPCSDCLANIENGVCDDGLCRPAVGCDLDCKNGGECYLDTEDEGVAKCNCPDGFTGQVCQITTGYCGC